jgi:hypothetical protein
MKNKNKKKNPIPQTPETPILTEAPKVEITDPTKEAPPPVMISPAAVEDEKLWQLYLARVAKSETINTMRRDIKVIFREALAEAHAALAVWNEKKEVEKNGR